MTERWQDRAVPAQEAVRAIGSNMRVFIHGAATVHLHLEGRVAIAGEEASLLLSRLTVPVLYLVQS